MQLKLQSLIIKLNGQRINMANLNNMGTGKKLLDQVLALNGPKVKHWYNQQNLTANKSTDKFNVQKKTDSQNPFKK